MGRAATEGGMKIEPSTAAVVTGGASGLGEATARMLAAAGARVALFDRDAARGEAVAAEMGGLFCLADVTSEASVEEALARARAAHGTERILVNCAGIAPGKRVVSRKRDTGELVGHDLDSFARVIAVNLTGTFLMIARSAAGMAALDPVTPDGGRGVVICTASIAAEDGQVGQAAYAASKGGVLAMTLPVARDLASYGIRVVTIMPGLFHTPMFDGVAEDYRKALEASVPFPARLGRPEEYAALARSIIENDMLNGTAIRLDGAIRMQPR
jgi:NAD(P)-dependent dehydrogenase (short-subunit alcohol dehydrogenase family)